MDTDKVIQEWAAISEIENCAFPKTMVFYIPGS